MKAHIKCQVELKYIRHFFFDDKMVEELRKRKEKILFISDIRTADWKIMNEEEVEDSVENDQKMQANWHINLNPKCSMLKFRLPWGKGTSKYLNGDIYLPVWGPQTTTETRLVTTSGFKEYDHTKYEEQLFYFNTKTRVSYYEHNVEFQNGYDHCYDCASEIRIVTDFLKKIKFKGQIISDELLKEETIIMAEIISKECSPHGQRHIRSDLPAPETRTWFKSKIFDINNKKLITLDEEEKEKLSLKKEDILTLERNPRGKDHCKEISQKQEKKEEKKEEQKIEKKDEKDEEIQQTTKKKENGVIFFF